MQNILACAVERDDIRPPTLNSRNIQLSITSYTPPTRVFIYKVCRPSCIAVYIRSYAYAYMHIYVHKLYVYIRLYIYVLYIYSYIYIYIYIIVVCVK